ncbi:conserved oligomeric Golgi complex subunit 7 [Ochlerotatus camptorhynchus]|uniref:conserved oligomeric Golgi complex subunit 7 n=1 Tax=Ochlerotatus camptorhynchus TaxID=644619 RepID=UPI0031D1434E
MDLTCFSQDSFDVVQWTNDYFKSNGSVENKDVMVSSLVSRLQLYVEQMNYSLEKSSHQLMITMPHVIKDLKITQAEVVTLTDKMRQLQNDISHVNRDTGVYMHKLERLESTFQKISIAKHGMKESDGWGKLTAELDDLLERNDVFESKTKFIDLKNSISAQTGLPGQTERALQFEYFTNRLEALASPAVIQHIQHGDVPQCLKYVEIFRIIDRSPQLKQCYRTVHKNALVEKWSKLSDAEGTYDTNVLLEFNNALLDFVQNQQKWCKQVFHSSLEPLDTIVDTLKNLQSSKQSFVMNQLKKSPNKFEYLASIANRDCHFAHALENILIELPKDKLDDLSVAIFMYFDVFVEQYPNLERSYSNKMLDEMKLNSTSVAENVSTLDNCNSKILKWFTDAIIRCTNITQNKSLVQLINIFRSFVITYIGKYTTVQKQLVLNQSEEVNWSLLQLNINLLQYLGDFMQVIEQCEKKLYASMNAKELDSNNSTVCLLRYLRNNEKVRDAVTRQTVSESNVLFVKELNALQKVAVEIHDSVLKHIFIYIETQFKEVEFTMKQHSKEYNLPDYSYAPQEYITQIGQYLLTLPQHLEPLLLSPSPALKCIMQFCEEKYKSEKACADVLLFLIVEETTAMYQEKIDEILCLSASGAKQLATDIEYFGNVLEEMSLTLSSNLQQIITLLRAPLDQYNAVSVGCNPRVVTSIRQKRNILSC